MALADVGNVSKAKYIFAINVTPISKMTLTELLQITTDEQPCPFVNFGDIMVDKDSKVRTQVYNHIQLVS